MKFEVQLHSDVVDRKEKLKAAIARLQSLKHNVSELRMQLETLKDLQSEKQEKAFHCNQCGKTIRKGKEITIRNSFGEIKKSYHEDCFKFVISY